MELSRSFSEETIKDRTFEIGGEVFKWRYPYWEEVTAWFDEDAQMLSDNDSPGLTATQNIELAVRRIETYLDPDGDSVKRWRALARRKTNPVPHWQFGDLYVWLLEVSGRRPTVTPTRSDSGPGKTTPTSKDA